MSKILDEDLLEVEHKWNNAEYYSCEVHDIGRWNVIWEIVICCTIGKLSKDFKYYRILFEGDMESDLGDFDEDIKNDFVMVQPTMKLVKVYEEIK